MAEVYKIAVALTMASNAPAFLSALSSQLLHVHTKVKDLEGGLNRLNRIKLAVGGGLSIAGGAAGLAMVGKMVDRGNELVKIQQNMAAAGVKATEVQEAYAKAWTLTGKYQNVGAAEALKVISEARMTFGSQHEATHHAEDFVKMVSFLKAFQGGKHGEGAANFEAEAIAAMKSGEIAGKVSPAEMAEHVKQLTAMRVAYGDQLKIGQYLTAQRAAGVALRNTSDAFRYGMFPALVQENGQSAGTMLMTAFNKIVAGTGNRTRSLEHMADIGLLHRDQLLYDKAGRIKGLKDPSAIMNNKGAAMNFGDWVMGTLRPLLDKRLDKEGITGQDRAIREAQLISAMFPDRNAAKAITEVLQQFSKLTKDAALMAEARKSLNEGVYLDKSWEGQKQAFETQWHNLLEGLGSPMVAQATAMLRDFNQSMSGVAQWAGLKENAESVSGIFKAIAVGSAALTAGGAAALLAAIGPTGWLVAGITALVAIDFKSAQAQWDMARRDIGLIVDFAKWAGERFDTVAKALEPLTGKLSAIMGKGGEDGDAMGRFVTGLVKIFDQLDKVMFEAAQKLGDEIKSWPGKLAEAIASMGAEIVAKIKAALASLGGIFSNPGNVPAIGQPMSFEGGGIGAMIQKASYGSASNDNAVAAGGGFGRAFRSGGAGGGAATIGSGSDYHAVVGGKSYRAAYATGGRERVGSWLSFYQRPVSEGGLGMSADKARAMVAMTQGESGINLNPGSIGDFGTSIGTAQWRLGRATALKNLAAKMGKHWSDVGVQQQHMRNEMLGAYRNVYDAIQRAPSGEAALAEGINRFERPKYAQKAYNFRLPYLQGLRRGGAGAVPPAPAAPPPTAGPPPRFEGAKVIQANLHVDGKKMAQVVVRHAANAAKYPKHVGGQDTHGSWGAPGTTLTDAA